MKKDVFYTEQGLDIPLVERRKHPLFWEILPWYKDSRAVFSIVLGIIAAITIIAITACTLPLEPQEGGSLKKGDDNGEIGSPPDFPAVLN